MLKERSSNLPSGVGIDAERRLSARLLLCPTSLENARVLHLVLRQPWGGLSALPHFAQLRELHYGSR